MMFRKSLIIVALLVAFSALSLGDIIYLKSGRQLEVDDAQVVGEKVHFTVFNGRMSIALSAVAKIEKRGQGRSPRWPERYGR